MTTKQLINSGILSYLSTDALKEALTEEQRKAKPNQSTVKKLQSELNMRRADGTRKTLEDWL